MVKTLLIALVLCASAFGQTATVVELSKCDADKAKQLYEAKQKADAAWDAFNAEIGQRHKLSSFEFSKDFRFVVPKAGSLINSGTFPKFQPCSEFANGTCWTTAPYIQLDNNAITPFTGGINYR